MNELRRVCLGVKEPLGCMQPAANGALWIGRCNGLYIACILRCALARAQVLGRRINIPILHSPTPGHSQLTDDGTLQSPRMAQESRTARKRIPRLRTAHNARTLR